MNETLTFSSKLMVSYTQKDVLRLSAIELIEGTEKEVVHFH